MKAFRICQNKNKKDFFPNATLIQEMKKTLVFAKQRVNTNILKIQ